ncbi:MAG: endonuclease III [Phycisphaerae bacterium]
MARETLEQKQRRTRRLLAQLQKLYPQAKCSLEHDDPWQLLVATILSAQCTDVRVNMVTPILFKALPGPREMAAAPLEKIEKLIQSTGFYRNKAKALQAAATDILEKHGGKVPSHMEELTALRGVGRKTANVVLGNAFGQNVGVVVDTHVGRLAQRLGLTTQSNPEKVEQDLMKLVPQEDWTLWSHLLIYHGRALCLARKPACERCPLVKDCPTGAKAVKK